MENLLSKQELRELNIIEILSNSSEYIPISRLARSLHCSNRTIQNDLEEIKKHHSIFSIYSNPSGLFLRFNNNHNISDIYSYYLETTLSIKLLKYIFFNPHTTIDEVSEKLYISRTKLLNLIFEINSSSTPFNTVKIDKNLNIIGSEADIRLFYLRIFFNKNNLEAWPFPEIDRKELFTITSSLSKLFATRDDITEYYYCILIAINYYRTKHGFLTDSGSLPNLITSLSESKNITGLLTDFLRLFHLPLDFKDVNDIYFPFTEYILYNHHNDYMEIHDHPEFLKEYCYLVSALHDLSNELRISLPNKEDLARKIYNINKFYPFNITHINHILYREQFAPIIFNKWVAPNQGYLVTNFFMTYFETFYKTKIIEPERIAQLQFFLIANWEGFFQKGKQNNPRLKIGVYTSSGREQNILICNYLSLFFSNEFFQFQPISNKNFFNSIDYRLIISDIEIPKHLKKNLNVIKIRPFPTDRDIIKIMKKIYQFSI
ncbi:helix-turn-helix domain-containing protein [Streptococcus uberis]|uniref:helix-turn-helix domain-containing protein n=1 Tax=Streptococcus uberis TaxID=1349 RepID=UPI00214F99E3|nr:helix-turn-helix domain containing protein [Streptococcus uberis]MCR4254249.1 helix-turn-helix domain-containing protein [Streptococcus uberis]MCR4256064.1 helix-turn-helix domain-containing protein [Streptococcus uberis]MCR4262358.1 helix-turn-helix domain-containing protein [Streptococcus uberis]